MFFPALQFPLNSLSDEVRALFAIVQNGVHAVQGAIRQTGRDLLKIDLFSAHLPNIDDITNCYKPYFRGYHLFTSSRLLISSIHQQRRRAMEQQQSVTRKIALEASYEMGRFAAHQGKDYFTACQLTDDECRSRWADGFNSTREIDWR